MSKHVYKLGDRVRILRPRAIYRVGYPLHYKDLRTEASEYLKNLDMTSLGFRNKSYGSDFRDLVEGLAKALVLDRGYGGNERSIHYYPVAPAIPDNQLWSVFATSADSADSYDLQPMSDMTGKIAFVESKYVRHTGTRIPGGGGYDYEGNYDWENGSLANRKHTRSFVPHTVIMKPATSS